MASTSSQSEIEIINAFEGLAPSAPAPASASTSATSSSPLQKLAYDVFINHRGPDVKHTLAADIYNALHAMGIKVFLDSNVLQLGDFFPTELQQAMSSASLHVAIFSPTYAQSSWCLAEISFMLNTSRPIIPIFYQVQPDDLRHLVHGKGIYAASFLDHQVKGRYSMDKLEEWKKALHTVSFYKGESVNNNEEEQWVLKNIVNRVCKVMKIVPLEVAKYPVGLEEAVVDFEMTIRKSARTHSDVQIVGIWGMGGSGKTTLTKELYNQKYSSIKKCSFLFDIRNAASKNELHKMQMQLLQYLEFHVQPFNNVEQGKNILSNYLRSVPVFIVLDDVDHKDQVEALLPAKDRLASGSLIIVTTRDKEVLRVCDISCIYEMKPMNQIHARQLFCWHAFLRPSPLSGFEDLVEKFISVSNGLPLSLKVFGAQLYRHSNKDLWEDVLYKISRILPDDIINRLRVSYDALDEEEQQMFLDIACFFIGKDKMAAIAVWEESGWSGLYGWERLVNKCLVELVDENMIRMHDHLRDLGRMIASTLSPHRLWSPNQFTNIDKPEQIRGMILLNAATDDVHKFPGSLLITSMCCCGFKITRRPFPYGLKVLMVGENYRNNLHIAKLSRELALLKWTGIAHRNLPSWISLKNLRVLELYDSDNIEGLWKDGVKAPVQLRVLSISSCPKLERIPKSIRDLENLKKISLSRCNVERLPKEFCRLRSLEHLQLKYCERLSSLPSCFGHLTNLRHLDLDSCYALRRLPDSCKQLKLLEHLSLSFCIQLTLQSDILENTRKLEYLNLSSSPLEELPRHITNQAPLSELYLTNTRLRELPINIGELSQLRVVEIGAKNDRCFQMRSLPDSMGSLSLLEQLEIHKCQISEFDFGREASTCLWRNLKAITLQSTSVSKISISDDCCPVLKDLHLLYNEQLREVETVPTSVKEFSVFESLIKNLSALGGAVNLQYLSLLRCTELDTLPSFDKLDSLKVFALEGDNKVETIQGLQHCTSLEELKIEGKCWEVSSIESWEHVQRLRRLNLAPKKRSAVERCIQTIQKWPEEIFICMKAVAGAGSFLKSSIFPNLSVVHSVEANEKIYGSMEIDLKLFNRSSDGNAMMVCLVMNCRSPRMRVFFCGDLLPRLEWEAEEGKLALIFSCLTPRKFSLWHSSDESMEVESGVVLMGEEESVVEGVRRLLPLLAI